MGSVRLHCDPMVAPDVLIEHYGPLVPGDPCDWQIDFTDRARPGYRVYVWDNWAGPSCVEANQLARALREHAGVMAALRTGDLEWAYELADAVVGDAEAG